MDRRKNAWAGFLGSTFPILLAVVIMNRQAPASPFQTMSHFLFLTLLLYFVGLFIKRLNLGLLRGIYMTAFSGTMAAPAPVQGPLALCSLGPLRLRPLFARAGKKASPAPGATNEKEGQKAKEAKKATSGNAIFFIKPHILKADVIYEAVDKGGFIYFCKCGNQVDGIAPGIAKNAGQTEEELLIDKQSFRVKKEAIARVEIHTKTRGWAGHIPNKGTVFIYTDKKLRFMIHEVHSLYQVKVFLTGSLKCPVTVCIAKQKKKAAVNLNSKKQCDVANKRAREATAFLNGLGWISGLWLILFPVPVHLAVGVGLLVPVLGLCYYMAHGPFVSFDEKRHQSRAHVSTAVLLPAAGLSLLSLTMFNIVFGGWAWCLFLACTAVVSTSMLAKRKEYKRQKSLLVYIPVYVFAYVFGAITSTNCLFDFRTPEHYVAETLDKNYSDGSRPHEYSLVISGWPGGKEALKPYVSSSLFDAIEIGDPVQVYVYPGLWGIAWYDVQLLPRPPV